MKNYSVNTESREQIELMKWAALVRQTYPQLDFMFHVANGGHRHPSTAARLKAEGVKPGVPDLMLPFPCNGYAGMFIELKKRVGGRLSDEQKLWREYLSSVGYCVRVCAGWEVAKDAIIEYLTPKTHP